MARMSSAAVAAACLLAFLGGASVHGFVLPSSSAPSVTTGSRLMAAVESEADDAPATKANLDHEHATAPTYDAQTTTSLEKYQSLHAESIKNPSKFWSAQARELLSWYEPFNPHAVMGGSLDEGDVRWFAGGKMNVAYNAIDRHVEAGRGEDVAIVWEVS